MRTKPYATAIALFDEVELLDVAGPISVLSAAGRQWNFQPFKIDLVANRTGPIATRSALMLEATHSAPKPHRLRVLNHPWGLWRAPRRGRRGISGLATTRSEHCANCVAAIGNGVWLLAQAGPAGRSRSSQPARSWRPKSARCAPALASTRSDALCISGKFLSTRKSALGLDLSCEIVARCFGKKLASSLSAELGIDWSGELGALDIVPSPLLVK